ncbi:MAG: hypothetical protein PUD43_03140, partial [Clostridia bacterium]|nr:hypothetical protein [Clostridia bacterium]
MKKKLALLMAAIMTVAMVPMTAFASTKLTAVDEISAGVGKTHPFESRVELRKNDDQVDVEATGAAEDGTATFEVKATLENGKFTDEMFTIDGDDKGIKGITKVNDTTAVIALDANVFNGKHPTVEACVLTVKAYALEAGDVVIKFTSNVPNFKAASEVIATAATGKVTIESAGVKTFVEDGENPLAIKDITIKELREDALSDGTITLKLNGDWKFVANAVGTVKFLNSSATGSVSYKDDDELIVTIDVAQNDVKLEDMTISGIQLEATKKCDAGDVATITVKSDMFDSVKLEVAKMVAEAVTYTVEDDDLPVIYAGKANTDENTLQVSVEENTGD